MIHTPFIDKIFIAFSYWVDYRPGLHLLTLWNMNHVLLWGEEDKQGDGRKDGNTITENSKFPYDCELMLFDWGPACTCLCWWRDVFKFSFWCSLWPLTRTYSSTQGLHHKTKKGFNQMSEREGRTEQRCHMFLAVKAPKLNDIFSARWWQVHSEVLNVVIDNSK